MRRFIPVALVLVLVLSCALPASADEFITTVYDGYWIDLLDYTQVFDTGNYGKPPVGVSRLTIDMPYTCTVGIVDMVVGCYLPDVDLYVVHPRDGALKLNKIAITGYGGKMYRYYLAFPVWDMSQLVLQCDTGNQISWLEFHAVRISTKSAISSFTPLNGTAVWGNGAKDLARDPNNTNPAYVDIPSQSMNNNDFSLTMFIPEWKEYDFVDMQLSLNCLSISSISATFNGSSVPLDISYLDNTAMGGYYYLNITVDMRYLFRGASRSPTITISGKLFMDQENYISLEDCHGFVLLDTTDPLYYRFKSVTDELRNQTQQIVDALNPPADTSIGDELVSQGQQIENYEQSHQNVLQSGVTTLQKSANIGKFSTALAFVGNYTTSIFNAMGDFQVVYTLPLTIGLILFLSSRVRGNDKPRKNDYKPKAPTKKSGTTSGNDSVTYTSDY